GEAREGRGGAGEDGAPMRLAGDGLRGAGNTAGLSQRLGRAQQRLGGHAGVVGAFAPDTLGLHDGHAVALGGQPPGEYFTGGPGSDRDHIKRRAAHSHSPLLLACASATLPAGRRPAPSAAGGGGGGGPGGGAAPPPEIRAPRRGAGGAGRAGGGGAG